METLIPEVRSRIVLMADKSCIGEHGNADYLLWMVDTVEKERTWPRDKSVRWLGFVVGAVDFALYGPQDVSIRRMVDIDCRVLSFRHPVHERLLFSAMDEVLEGLEAIAEERASAAGVELAEAARRSPNAMKASFCLGYLQAYMTGWKMIDVDSERDRTRPIFHRIYAACGYDIPKSKDRASDSLSDKEN